MKSSFQEEIQAKQDSNIIGFPRNETEVRHGWILISEENKVIVWNFDRDSN